MAENVYSEEFEEEKASSADSQEDCGNSEDCKDSQEQNQSDENGSSWEKLSRAAWGWISGQAGKSPEKSSSLSLSNAADVMSSAVRSVFGGASSEAPRQEAKTKESRPAAAEAQDGYLWEGIPGRAEETDKEKEQEKERAAAKATYEQALAATRSVARAVGLGSTLNIVESVTSAAAAAASAPQVERVSAQTQVKQADLDALYNAATEVAKPFTNAATAAVGIYNAFSSSSRSTDANTDKSEETKRAQEAALAIGTSMAGALGGGVTVAAIQQSRPEESKPQARTDSSNTYTALANSLTAVGGNIYGAIVNTGVAVASSVEKQAQSQPAEQRSQTSSPQGGFFSSLWETPKTEQPKPQSNGMVLDYAEQALKATSNYAAASGYSALAQITNPDNIRAAGNTIVTAMEKAKANEGSVEFVGPPRPDSSQVMGPPKPEPTNVMGPPKPETSSSNNSVRVEAPANNPTNGTTPERPGASEKPVSEVTPGGTQVNPNGATVERVNGTTPLPGVISGVIDGKPGAIPAAIGADGRPVTYGPDGKPTSVSAAEVPGRVENVAPSSTAPTSNRPTLLETLNNNSNNNLDRNSNSCTVAPGKDGGSSPVTVGGGGLLETLRQGDNKPPTACGTGADKPEGAGHEHPSQPPSGGECKHDSASKQDFDPAHDFPRHGGAPSVQPESHNSEPVRNFQPQPTLSRSTAELNPQQRPIDPVSLTTLPLRDGGKLENVQPQTAPVRAGLELLPISVRVSETAVRLDPNGARLPQVAETAARNIKSDAVVVIPAGKAEVTNTRVIDPVTGKVSIESSPVRVVSAGERQIGGDRVVDGRAGRVVASATPDRVADTRVVAGDRVNGRSGEPQAIQGFRVVKGQELVVVPGARRTDGQPIAIDSRTGRPAGPQGRYLIAELSLGLVLAAGGIRRVLPTDRQNQKTDGSGTTGSGKTKPTDRGTERRATTTTAVEKTLSRTTASGEKALKVAIDRAAMDRNPFRSNLERNSFASRLQVQQNNGKQIMADISKMVNSGFALEPQMSLVPAFADASGFGPRTFNPNFNNRRFKLSLPADLADDEVEEEESNDLFIEFGDPFANRLGAGFEQLQKLKTVRTQGGEVLSRGSNDDETEEESSNQVMLRPTWLISEGETLVSLAEELFNDSYIGWLIADLNTSQSKEHWMDGKRIVEFSSRQQLTLPVWQDIVDFYGAMPVGACPENLITIVKTTQLDREIVDSQLSRVMGTKLPVAQSSNSSQQSENSAICT